MAPAAVEDAGPRATDVPSRRDGWLSPIELDERAEPLTTATPAPRLAPQPRGASVRVASRASDRGVLPMTLQSYLELLDWTGRQLRAGTQGVIPRGLESMLDRLQVSAESWLETVAQFGRRFHRAIGSADHLKAEAQRLGVNWLQGIRSSQVAFATHPVLDCPRSLAPHRGNSPDAPSDNSRIRNLTQAFSTKPSESLSAKISLVFQDLTQHFYI